MELKDNLTNGQVLIWNTEVVFDREIDIRESPVFKFQRCEWYLECRLFQSSDFNGCRLTMNKKGRKDPVNRIFYVECCAVDRGEEMCWNSIAHAPTMVMPLDDVVFLFLKELHAMEKEIKDFLSHGKVAFVLIFRAANEPVCLNCQTNIADRSMVNNMGFELEDVCHSFDFLLENDEFADVQLKCGDCAIPAHKSVLAAHSEVFLAMFRSKMKEESSGVVDIPDVESPVLKAFLKALYSGKLPDTSDDMVPKLYTVCDKYAVLSLRKLCSERMVSSLSEDNYQDYLLLADAHNDDDFKNSVHRFICNQPQIITQETWLNFSDEYPKLTNSVYLMCLSKLGFMPARRK